jgi:hypothetical protein
MIRIRTIIAVMVGALAIAVPVSTAGAAVPAASATPRTIDLGAGVSAPFQVGAQAAVDGWTAGANAALSGWNVGLQAAAGGFQAGANALTGLQAQLMVGLP